MMYATVTAFRRALDPKSRRRVIVHAGTDCPYAKRTEMVEVTGANVAIRKCAYCFAVLCLMLSGCATVDVHRHENSFGLHWGHIESVDYDNITQG